MRLQREAEKRELIRRLSPCVRGGYEWMKEANGFYCAGGSHFVTDKELEDLYVNKCFKDGSVRFMLSFKPSCCKYNVFSSHSI